MLKKSMQKFITGNSGKGSISMNSREIELDFTIRPVTAEDESLIDDFFAVMGDESRAFFNRHDGNHQSAVNFCRNPEEKTRYFLAEADGAMIGLVFLWDLNTTIPWLGIAVRENLKGKHIGRKLIAFAQDYAREHGKGGIQLTTHIANLRGQSLYETMGFRRMGIYGPSGEFYYLFRYTDE
jgi:ribosomal protein S18 acetylase RimI-like enzyme